MNRTTEYEYVKTEWTSIVAPIVSTIPTKSFSSPYIIVLDNGLMKNPSSSHPNRSIGVARTWREQHLAQIRAIKGKYASVLTSSEDFAKRKRQETRLER